MQYGHTAREKFGHNLKYCGVVRTDAGFSWVSVRVDHHSTYVFQFDNLSHVYPYSQDAVSARLGRVAGNNRATAQYLQVEMSDYPSDKVCCLAP